MIAPPPSISPLTNIILLAYGEAKVKDNLGYFPKKKRPVPVLASGKSIVVVDGNIDQRNCLKPADGLCRAAP